jgi:hypothetical protein
MVMGVQPIEHLVHLQPLGFSTKREKVMDRIDVSSGPTRPDAHDRRHDPSRRSGPGAGGRHRRPTRRSRCTPCVGIDETARWIAPTITHQALGEEFGLVAVSVTAYTMDDDPEVP